MRKYLLLISVLIIITVALGFTTQIVTLQGPKPDWVRYYSPNKQYCFELIPSYSRQITDTVNTGTFYKIEGKSFQKVWSLNVAPALVLLPNSGQYIVIFNTWHPENLEEDVVSIYDRTGNLIQILTVKDIVGDKDIYRVPIMEFFPFFGQGHYIDDSENCIILDIIFGAMTGEHIEFRYYINTGDVVAERAVKYYFPYSQIKRISPDGLSLAQIDLAIDELYARHGYIFDDKNIQQLFSKKIWYKKNDDFSEKDLNDIEMKNIKRLQLLKERYHTYSPDTILFTKLIGDNYIIYTGSIRLKPRRYCLYICPKLCKLKDVDDVAIYKALLDDAGSPIQPEQIVIKDVILEYFKEAKPEILINRIGPSDDYSQICLGLDDEGNFIRYYLIWGKVKEFETVERDITFIKTVKLMSYYARYENYIFNSTSFALAKVGADEFYVAYLNTPGGKRTRITTIRKTLEVFPNRWLKEWQGSERFTVPKGDTVAVLSYSTCCGGMFEIHYKDQCVWATEEDVDKCLKLIHAD